MSSRPRSAVLPLIVAWTQGRRGRNRDAVVWHDLRLEGEDVLALRVDECLHSVHVVRPVRLIVAERLHAGEVLEASSLAIQEGLVDAEVVRVLGQRKCTYAYRLCEVAQKAYVYDDGTELS